MRVYVPGPLHISMYGLKVMLLNNNVYMLLWSWYNSIISLYHADSELVLLLNMGTNIPLLLHGLGLFTQKVQCLQKNQYDVALQVCESHKSAESHTLIWCGC